MRRVDHTSFTIERSLKAGLARSFRAFSVAEEKREWFACHDGMETLDYSLDCRAGGSEINRIRMPGGAEHLFLATYLDVVPENRIIYAYSMHVGEIRLSASLVTIIFSPRGDSTAMHYTEQVAMLDGHQPVEERIHGTEMGLDMLERWLG